MAAVVGFAFLWLSVTPVGKRVFLLVVATTPNAMLCMTTSAGMVQKAAFGRSKSPPLAVKKQLIISSSLTLPKGRGFVLAVFEEVVITLFFLKKAGMESLLLLFPSPWGRLGWGLWWMGHTPGNSVRVAISRRRYSQSDIIRLPIPAHHPAAGNAYG